MTRFEILSAVVRARECLRDPVYTATDREQDYWAGRLVFWNEMLRDHDRGNGMRKDGQ